ncbi:13493_t:CDS:1, partial [Funneliformis mosseae]
YVHCDIRLPNIVLVPDISDYRYILIDFEHGSKGGLEATEHLKDWDNATLTKNNSTI